MCDFINKSKIFYSKKCIKNYIIIFFILKNYTNTFICKKLLIFIYYLAHLINTNKKSYIKKYNKKNKIYSNKNNFF